MDVQALWTEINRWGLFFGCYEHIAEQCRTMPVNAEPRPGTRLL